MAKIHGLHSRYLHYNDQQALLHNSSSELLGPMKHLSFADACEQKCEDACDNVATDNTSEATNPTATSNAAMICNEQKQMQHLACILFRPGAKLSGSIDITNNSNQQNQQRHREASAADQMLSEVRIFKEYELVVMEMDAMDEMGNAKGILARHKIGGDEQCVFIKLSFVHIATDRKVEKIPSECKEVAKNTTEAEEKEFVKDEEEKRDVEVSSPLLDGGKLNKNKLTILMEYADGEHSCQGRWNHDKLRFEGTVKKSTEGRSDPNPMGGTIISGLISGRSNRNIGDGNSTGNETNNNTGARSSLRGKEGNEQNFSLSPCSHLHPRGITSITSWNVSKSLSEISLKSRQLSNDGDVDRSEEKANLTPTSIGVSTTRYKPKITPENKKVLLGEIESLDNLKLILHRSRTESLRREALMKLVELGTIIDFADLARKRNAAKRREKWRSRVRKYTPKLPSRLALRRGRTSSSTISKDSQTVVQKKVVPFYDHLAAILWADLLDEASVQTERMCAIFRHRAALLDSLTFESDEYKAQVMADLRLHGISLASTHSEWDRCIQMGRTVALGWSWFERGSWGCFQRSAVVGQLCVYLLFQMHSRLEASHERLEKAYRSADARITMARLNKLTKRPTVAEDAELVCAVCHCDMNEEEEDGTDGNHAVFLPCSHCFHWGCIREWLHNHSQCPTCRLDLNDVPAY